jgi:hypothetical protein
VSPAGPACGKHLMRRCRLVMPASGLARITTCLGSGRFAGYLPDRVLEAVVLLPLITLNGRMGFPG